MSEERGVIVVPRLNLLERTDCPFDVTCSFSARRIFLGKDIKIDMWLYPQDLRQYLMYWDRITIPTLKFGVGGALSSPYLNDEDLAQLYQYGIFDIEEIEYNTVDDE